MSKSDTSFLSLTWQICLYLECVTCQSSFSLQKSCCQGQNISFTILSAYYVRESKKLFRTSRLSVLPSVHPLKLPFFPILAVVSQNFIDESCFECVKSEKYVIWVTLRPLRSIRQGEAELRTLQCYLTCS